ncbi:hypothetical protein [Spirillospora sp. NPDC048819]|uniref:RNA polymerase sigma factor n=1 Tax=Spirillospora sp. NPDC048819 TaxID=3155268 RepID=UPI0033D278EB
MHGDLETLYDAHAHRLYAHCWSLLGDRGAADALRETLTRAVRQPPRGETVLWLHHLAHTVCAEQGAFGRQGRPVFAQAAIDPLLDGIGSLSAGHREVLLLSAGKWLEVRDIAGVLRISPDSVHELLHQARTALERFVLDVLIRGTADPAKHMDVISAFEKGRLPHLLARRAPTWAPAPLRDRVLAAADRERDEFGPASAEAAAADGPLVVIDSGPESAASARKRPSRRKAVLKGVGGVTGVAATVAAGLMMTWPSPGGGTMGALGPHESTTRPGPVPTSGVTEEPGASESPAAGRNEAAPAPTPTTKERAPVTEEPSLSGGGTAGPTTAPERDAPSTSSPTPPTSRQETPPPTQESPEPQPDRRSRTDDGPLDPITDIVGHLTSPLLGGLAGG